MPITVQHVKNVTIADATNTNIVRPSDWNSAHNVTYSPDGNEIIKWASAGTNSISSGTLVFGSSAGNVTFGMNPAGYVTASAPTGGAGDGYNLIAAGSQTAGTTGTVKFADSNGISFGMSNSTQVTASYTVPSTAGLVSHVNWSAGTTSNNSSAIKFADGSGISFGLNAGTITATVKTDYLTSQSNQAVSAGNGSSTFQTLSLADSNGVSFSTGTQGVYATVKTDYLTTAALSNHSHGNPTLALTNLAGTTASNSAGLTLSLSATAQSAQSAIKGFGVSNTGQTAGNTGLSTGIDWVLAGSQSITLSQSTAAGGPNTVWLQHPAWITTAMQSNAATISNVNWSAGTTSNNSSAIKFADGSGISFGLNAGTITATVKTDYQSSNANYLTSQSNQAVSAGNGSSTFQTLSLADSNGVSFSTGTQGVYATVKTDYLTTAANSTHTHTANLYVSSNTTQLSSTAGVDLRSITFQGAGVASVGVSEGKVVVSVPAGGGAADGVNIIQLGTTLTTGTSWSSSNATVFLNGGTNVTVSQNNSNQLVINGIRFQGENSGAGAVVSNGGTLSFNAGSADKKIINIHLQSSSNGGTVIGEIQDNVSFGVSTGGNTAGSTGTVNYGKLIFAGGNNITASQSTNAGEVTVSMVGPNMLSAGVSNIGTTSGDTGMVSNRLVLAGVNNISLYQSTDANGATVRISDSAAFSTHSHGNPTLNLTNLSGTTASNSGGLTLSLSAADEIRITQRVGWPPGNFTAVAAMGNGSFSINRMQAYAPISATRLDMPMLISIASSATTNTWGFVATCFGAVYTKNVSTLSSLSSGSTAFSFSLASNTAGSTQMIPHAIRPYSIPMDVNMSVGEYYIGFGISTNTRSVGLSTTALGITQSVMGGPIYSSAVPQVGDFSETTNTSTGLWGGQGVYSAAISTVPPAVSLSAINQTGSYYARGNFAMIFRNI